jgi:hypothetical protein
MHRRATIVLLAALAWTAPAFASGSWGGDDLDVFDGRWKLPENHLLVTELHGEGQQPLRRDRKERRFGGDALLVRYAFEAGDWFAKARYGHTDDTIRAGKEFTREIGTQHTQLVIGRSWGGHSRGWWAHKTLSTTYQTRHLNDGQLLADTYTTELGLSGNLQSRLQVQYQSGREFQGGLLFDFDRTVVSGRIRPATHIELGVQTDHGEKFDFANTRLAEQQRVDPFVNWKLSDRLSLQLSASHVDLDTTEGQWILDASVYDAQLTWQIDWRGSLNVTLQKQDIARNPDAYLQNVMEHTRNTGGELLYTWKLNPQAELHFGYSDVFADNAEISVLADRNRNWFMRFGYTL